jgi:hypothetical protein
MLRERELARYASQREGYYNRRLSKRRDRNSLFPRGVVQPTQSSVHINTSPTAQARDLTANTALVLFNSGVGASPPVPGNASASRLFGFD